MPCRFNNTRNIVNTEYGKNVENTIGQHYKQHWQTEENKYCPFFT